MKLTLIRGLPGSGKSTLAKTLPGKHFEADMFFIDDNGDYHYDSDKIEQAHLWCQSEAEKALANGEDVVIANTFVRLWEMKAYRTLAKRYRAQLEVIVCNGSYPNIHGVSDEVVDRMRRRWQD
ncbi:ATP-binding protein [Vibrio hangzhouensis]|uniref:ATP-binding protein n=1 Tax=Vibrio hangzhouensis TaxID=462991 RepID=UPI001C968A4B|nr:ATP-binding protein [Vibrio hangzhouensis]MBY6196511.1 ATP-binding protein [Vibrio hangzhouensis]